MFEKTKPFRVILAVDRLLCIFPLAVDDQYGP